MEAREGDEIPFADASSHSESGYINRKLFYYSFVFSDDIEGFGEADCILSAISFSQSQTSDGIVQIDLHELNDRNNIPVNRAFSEFYKSVCYIYNNQ